MVADTFLIVLIVRCFKKTVYFLFFHSYDFGFRDMCNSQKKLPVGDGDEPGPQLLGHLICLFTLIINIYGLGVGISTIIKFTSGRGGV
jgi:hypothetical protein